MSLTDLKPLSKQLVYDLVTQAGVNTSDWPKYARFELPASNPKYCYDWSFEGNERVVVCLWFEEMKLDIEAVFQILNYRAIAASRRLWHANQRKRARKMDHAIQLANNLRLPIHVIVVDGTRRGDSEDRRKSKVERRMLDTETWHVAAYDDDGNCRLQRGPWPTLSETFTLAEITATGTFNEGAQVEVTAQIRERSQHLRALARSHFAKQSPDGRLHCAVCDWTPPQSLQLTSPIVEIHHGLGISEYPKDGRALNFDEAIQHLTPLCPNCHRVLHSKRGGGTFTLEELRQDPVRRA